MGRKLGKCATFLSLIPPQFLNRFTSGFHQNYLLFKCYKVRYNRTCPNRGALPVQFPNFQPQLLKLGRGLCPLSGNGAGSPSNTNSPGLRPTSIPSGILMHPAVWPQQKWAENWRGGSVPFWGKRTVSPSNTKSPGLRPTCVPSQV